LVGVYDETRAGVYDESRVGDGVMMAIMTAKAPSFLRGVERSYKYFSVFVEFS
jgi:hypothetical protein